MQPPNIHTSESKSKDFPLGCDISDNVETTRITFSGSLEKKDRP